MIYIQTQALRWRLSFLTSTRLWPLTFAEAAKGGTMTCRQSQLKCEYLGDVILSLSILAANQMPGGEIHLANSATKQSNRLSSKDSSP
ncbi:hypothetical protein F4805DRAFT_271434 [Annulohypoxylon moriforme]|nr:hypothetical protein F4805DRAFT_271434 [Annulohypoxylon moriforme]